MLNINFVIKLFYTLILLKLQSTYNSLVQTNHTNIKYDFSAGHLFSPVIFMRLHLLFNFRHLYDWCTVGHLCLPEVLELNILELRMTQFWTNDCISGLTKMIHMQMQVGIATIRATPEICSKENSTGNSKLCLWRTNWIATNEAHCMVHISQMRGKDLKCNEICRVCLSWIGHF